MANKSIKTEMRKNAIFFAGNVGLSVLYSEYHAILPAGRPELMADITLKAYLAHVDDLLGRRQYEEAEAHSKHILAKYPKNLAALRRLAKAQLEAGHYPEAENTYATVLSLEPRSTEAYVGLSWVARQRGQGDQTIAL